ncbi:DUF6049 family protein [Mycobacterium sp. 1274756.6]|uniref:DUF6049 family protein n=1 Tax=Mycobacterium sp. 1274756.6 TaxID=1834076 RepID=UPI0007FF1B08|nr:hypothetical protein A5643_14480 [Mycobacterium sp. 1274756.6]
MRRLVAAALASGLAALLVAPGAVPPAAADAPDAAPFIRVSIDSVTPAVLTGASDPQLTVTGRIKNIGDRPVRDVTIRLEQAAAVDTATELRTPLRGQHDQFQPIGEFRDVAATLPRRAEVGFTLSAPLDSESASALQIAEPGVYPVLVNVNATPDYGVPARLDDARFLLPVLELPADAAGSRPGDGPAATTGEAAPMPVTMLWPLADRPRLAPGFPGGTTPIRLTDDDLAASLAAGGRLDVLLSTVEFATSPGADPDGLLGRSLCLAVDPDLLVTVNAMTRDYLVTETADPGGPAHPGLGQAAAAGWLSRLRSLAARLCVTALPYAQADLTALQRVGDTGMATIATSGASQVVDQMLGVSSVRGATPLGDGPLTQRAVDLLSGQADTVAITPAPAVPGDDGADGAADLTPRRLSPRVVTAPFDPAVGAALAAVGTRPTSPLYLDSRALRKLKQNLQHDSAVARRQDALGAILWRALQPDAEPRGEILLPPATWALEPDDAHALLSTLGTALRAGVAVPRPLSELIAHNHDTAALPEPGYPPRADRADRGRIDDTVTTEIADQTRPLWGLTAALTTDPRTGLTGAAYTAPLREDMLRALSQAEPPAERNNLARDRLAAVGVTVANLLGGVTVVNPGGSYTLATEHSPLPLALRNDLAVPIRVRLHLETPPGMTVTDPGEIELPPGYLPLRVPIEVRLNQRVAVDAALSTPDGMPLGATVRLSVHANAYGKVLFAITLSAAAVLIVLAGRRLWHRFRGQPDPADLPEPRSGEELPGRDP